MLEIFDIFFLEPVISGLFLDLEWGYVFAFVFFIAMMFARPQGLLARRA